MIQEFDILEPEFDRSFVAKQKKKAKSMQRKESKEQKKQQQQQQQRQIVHEPRPAMKLNDFHLVDSLHNHDSSFTKVESKSQKLLRKGNKGESSPMNNNGLYNGSLDKLDEISISGPRPDARDSSRGSVRDSVFVTKSEHAKRAEHPQRRKSLQHVIQPAGKVNATSQELKITILH